MTRLVRDITTTMQTLRFAVALVLSTTVTTAVAGPMAYQAVNFHPDAALGARAEAGTSTEADRAGDTQPGGQQPGSKPSGGSASAGTFAAASGPDTSAATEDRTPTAPGAVETTVADTSGDAGVSTEPPAPAARVQSDPAQVTNPAEQSTTTVTQAPTTTAGETISPPLSAGPSTTTPLDPIGIGDLGPFGITTSCGDVAHELDDNRAGLCNDTSTTAPR